MRRYRRDVLTQHVILLAEAFGRALQVIRASGGSRTSELLEFSIALAQITLDSSIIVTTVEEAGMSMQDVHDAVGELLWNTSIGDEVRERIAQESRQAGLAAGHEQGLEQGREQGLEQGREQGRERMLLALIQDRFGPHPDAPGLAHRLAAWPDDVAAIHAVTTAADLDDLEAARALAGPPA